MASKFYLKSLPVFAFCILHFAFANGQTLGTWSNTGPINFPINSSGQVNGIGRVSQIKFHPTNSSKVYAVSASGGVYVSSNNGVSWTVMSGTEKLPQTSLSSLCINYANDQTLYLSLGDADYYSNNYGIYKSIDGGATWNAANTGPGTGMAVEILMDPSDTSKLVAATRNGIYRTTNAGSSWTLMQAGSFRDMKAKPFSGSKTLYAATATAFYYSTDFGVTWTQATSVAPPSGNAGMRIAVSAADTSRVYLLTTGGYGQVYKSTNSGTSFSTVYSSTTQCLVCYDATITSGSQGNYNIDVNANPQNANELLLVAHNVWRSTDAGATWSKRTTWYNECHTDMHEIQWNPYNNNQRWNANDGGVWMSTDTNATVWTPRSDGLAATEVYRAAQSPVVRDLISVGAQDNGELYYTAGAWKTNRGGDWSSPCAIDYRGSGNVWYTPRGTRRTLLPLGSDQSFNAPFVTNTGTFIQNDLARIEFLKSLPAAAFMGRDSIFRCTNTAATTPSWTLIKANTATLRDIISCRADSNILYVAVAPSTLYRSDNALATTPTWTTLTLPGSMSSTGSITTSRYNSQVVFASCNNAIYRSVDKGVTWTNITGTGLSGLNIRKIICDDYSPKQRLFVNAGVYVHSKDSTATAWTITSGLPTVANATDLMIYNDGTAASILRLSTYGRGVWQCDINNNVPPSPDFFANKTSACPGDTVSFTNSVTGGFTSLSWTFTGGNPSSSSAVAPTVVYASPGIYPVSLTATNAYGSNSITKTGYITVTYGQTIPVMEGFEAATYPPVGWQTAGTGNWAPTTPGGYSLSTKSIVWDNYNVDAGGARDRIIAPRVNLTGVANARLKFDVAYAPYSTAYPDTLQVRVSTDCGRSWTIIYSKTGTTLGTAPTNTITTFVPTASQWRTDSVSLAAYTGSPVMISFDNIGYYGQDIYVDNVNILMSPVAAFGAAATSVCAGTTVSFSDSSLNATSWSWSFSGGTPTTSTVRNPVVTYNSSGTYSVTLTATNGLGNGVSTRTSFIQVNANPVVNLGNDTAICPSAALVLNAGNAGASYLWNTAATTQTQTVLAAGTYMVKVTNSNGCIGRDTIVVNSAGSNPIVALGNDTTICAGASLSLNAGNSGSNYLWSTTATTQSIGVSTAASYSVRVTNAQGCIGRDTIVVLVSAAPVVSLGADTTICPTATITLNAGNAGATYLWNTAATSQTISLTASGSYSVAVTNVTGCIGQDTIIISAASNPVVALGADTALCVGNSISLNAGNSGSSYLWSNAATTQSVTTAASGTYSVRVTNASGCVGRDTIVLTAAPQPVVNLGRDTVLCPGNALTLNAGNAGNLFLWNTSAATQSITASTAGSFSVRVTNAQGCIGRDTIVITAGTIPNAPITASGSVLNAGSAGSSYQWYRNGSLIAGATAATYHATQSGSYTVVVTNANGCTGTSPAYAFTAEGISTTLSDAGYELYPNPSNGIFSLHAKGISATEISLTCYDAAGNTIRTLILPVSSGIINASIDWSALARGVYAISIKSGANPAVRGTIVIR